MKKNLKTTGLFCLALMGLVSSCQDDLPGGQISIENGEKKVVWEYTHGFHDLKIESEESWSLKIVEGEWVSIVDSVGDGDALAQLYCEQNSEEESRTARIQVRNASGSQKEILIEQEGVQISDNNAMVPVTTLDYGCGVGWGYNGMGDYANVNYLKGQIINTYKLDQAVREHPDDLGGETFVDDDTTVNETSATVAVGSSITELTNSLAVNAGLEVNLPCGFSGSASANYSKSDMTNVNKNFSTKHYKHVFKRRRANIGNLSEAAALYPEILSLGFKGSVKKIANAQDIKAKESAIKRFISLYGTHIVTQGDIGGRMEYQMTTDKKQVSSEQDIKAGLEMGYKTMFNIQGDAHYNDMKKQIGENYTCSVVIKGGDSRILSGAANNVEGACTQEDIDRWIQSINESKCTLVDFQLAPIWEIITDEEVAAAVKEYLETGKILEEPEYKKYILPEISTPTTTKFKIPELSDETLIHTVWCGGQPVAEICQEFVSSLSLRDRVTVVYPIKSNKPDYSKGFFIGNSTHRPGTIDWVEKDGVYTPVYTHDLSYSFGACDSIFIIDETPSGMPKEATTYSLSGVEPTYHRFYKDNYLEGNKNGKGNYPLVKVGKYVFTREPISSYWKVTENIHWERVYKWFSFQDVQKVYYSYDEINFTYNGYDLPDEQVIQDLNKMSNNSIYDYIVDGGVTGFDLKATETPVVDGTFIDEAYRYVVLKNNKCGKIKDDGKSFIFVSYQNVDQTKAKDIIEQTQRQFTVRLCRKSDYSYQ